MKFYRSFRRTRRIATARKWVPTPSPPTSKRRARMRPARLRSPSLEAESSVDGKLRSRIPTGRMALKKSTETVASRKPNERQAAKIVTTSNKTLTSGQRTAASQHLMETNRSKVDGFPGEDDDDSEVLFCGVMFMTKHSLQCWIEAMQSQIVYLSLLARLYFSVFIQHFWSSRNWIVIRLTSSGRQGGPDNGINSSMKGEEETHI